MQRIVLSKIDYRNVLHPKDASGIAWVKKVPHFEDLLNKSVVRFEELYSDVVYTGNGFEITSESGSEVYSQYLEACKILHVVNPPILTSLWEYRISSDSLGGKKGRIMLTTGAIDVLTKEEFNFLLGHELGHILCGHKPYQSLLEILYSPFLDSVDRFNIASVVKFPLLEWFRISHYSADRVGLLCCQDINVALSAMIKMAGCPKKYHNNINVESFIKQADEFERNCSGTLNSLIEKFSVRAGSMPWLVVRVRELLDWYNSGEYQKIIDNA